MVYSHIYMLAQRARKREREIHALSYIVFVAPSIECFQMHYWPVSCLCFHTWPLKLFAFLFLFLFILLSLFLFPYLILFLSLYLPVEFDGGLWKERLVTYSGKALLLAHLVYFSSSFVFESCLNSSFSCLSSLVFLILVLLFFLFCLLCPTFFFILFYLLV
ncbi:hypothetical protein L228DRAFT_92828 [Xylona heveae TC161]|uniref:Uncharacterized protein n=1 Tax=Xylona heveae (strain CBS 132557 / TC161) TaxID=1328760 RepID=A0A165I2C1_XYLHT|nr:hypothetical protein L228DRAFT_92828 [Xylona heveae TC161]KZF24264.1 hypothetical protein L228DRAFT_92828 [Xylona heveae TC161]